MINNAKKMCQQTMAKMWFGFVVGFIVATYFSKYGILEKKPSPASIFLKRSDNDAEAKRLEKKVRVLCWILTCPENHETKARHLKATWGKRCSKLIFMSTANDSSLGAVALPGVKEGRAQLWAKTRKAFEHIFDRYIEDFDFFYKADDDTYAIMENLRLLLSSADPNDPVYFGLKFSVGKEKQHYMQGGAGYVLTRESVKRFARAVKANGCWPHLSLWGEDVLMGKCLQAQGVRFADTRDDLNRSRFHYFSPEKHVGDPVYINKSYPLLSVYQYKTGQDCCSDLAISFHHLEPRMLYVLDYLVYRLHPFGYEFASRVGPNGFPNRKNEDASTSEMTSRPS